MTALNLKSAARGTEAEDSPRARALGLAEPFAAAAARADEEDRFVAENYALLREAGLVQAGVPRELGGGGAGVAELAEMLRQIARSCGSTALAFSIHTHQVAVPAWRWRHQKVAAVEPLLKRIEAERLILLSSGGSDWIGGSGKAERVEGGYRIDARKIFASGAPAANLFMTSTVLAENRESSVLHFGVPMSAPEVRIEETWRALGMRGTGSHEVVIDGYVVPEAAVALKRKAGEWHPLFRIIATLAFPLIYGAYLGVADSAREIALGLARKRPADPHKLRLAGRMEVAHRAAELAHAAMVAEAERNQPSAESVNEAMIGRTLVAENAIRTVELAMELAGGAAFLRATGLERRFRDIQGARFHPLQQGPQADYAGALALGLPVVQIY